MALTMAKSRIHNCIHGYDKSMFKRMLKSWHKVRRSTLTHQLLTHLDTMQGLKMNIPKIRVTGRPRISYVQQLEAYRFKMNVGGMLDI